MPLSLKLIPVLWVAVILCDVICTKFASEIAGWYLIYSMIIGVLTTVVLWMCASL